ncbi:MAG: Na(+)-translocating NADH-quinone reductase subunit A [Deltaproteobacteria bacterium]|nr:Na(+)-translocating NADH-quinone reductase subunit A [Deltaproteobacteria bacterium]MBW2421352.1 Na(+)-translocating NADH-quinone reductase subunit A [Deltaproteobacteria bacterium]
MHKIAKGLDLPISGQPIQIIRESVLPTRVAVMADDFPGLKPGMLVEEGETVKRGQPLLEDRKAAGVIHTAPGAGRVIGIYRGARRVLQSVVIDLSNSERAGTPDDSEFMAFESYKAADPASLGREDVVALLVESGLWTALRTRPFSKVPATDTAPAAIFVNAMDSNPLAPLPEVVLAGEEESFNRGLALLSKLTEGNTYLCIDPHSAIDDWVDAPVTLERFTGPHPAGTTGLHIHLVEPVSRAKTVWHIGYQDVVSAGKLFATGKLDVNRVISVAGPLVEDPRLLRTRVGACVDEITGNSFSAEARVIAGSVLSGKKAMGSAFEFMGRYDLQISVIREGREREFMGWLDPGMNKFSTIPIYLSRLLGGKRFDFTTATNGSPRAMVPIGMYERIMPLDILPTFLLRSLLVGDIERAEELGALELDEEDLALCTFVDPGKTDFGPVLRRNLEMIEKEG